MTSGNGLTDTQHKILQAIENLTAEQGYPPTLREVANAVGMSSLSGLCYQLGILQGAGYIRRVPGSPRTLQLDT